VEKETKEIMGGIGFLGDPDPDGMIEIGFATNESQQRKGYCFEASHKLLNWASIQEEVKCITARCKFDNINSKNVLIKLGFQVDHRDTELIYWKYPR
jgi:[ribosomal protein S5]-alanine N-acetyltransferase